MHAEGRTHPPLPPPPCPTPTPAKENLAARGLCGLNLRWPCCAAPLTLLLAWLLSLFSPRPSTLLAVHAGAALTASTDMGALFPKSTGAWVNVSDPGAGPCGLVPELEDGLRAVSIPRVSGSDAQSYGNMHTCKRGYRLHAYRGVNGSHFSFPCYTREVELSRGPEGGQGQGLPPVADEGSAGEEVVVFDIDTWSHNAFIHWVCESAVYLEYWDDLVALHPGIRLLLQQRKGYKLRFATELYGIPMDRIVFRDESPGFAALVALPSSITYFPPYLTLLEENAGDLPLFGALFHRLVTRLRRLAGVDSPPPWLPTRALILQRGSKENYATRVNPFVNALAERPGLLSSRVPLEVLVYDEFPSLKAQVTAQAEAKVFAVAYGSALFFNAALARNATVLIDNPSGEATHYFVYLGLALEYGERCNRRVVDLQASGVSRVEEVLPLLEAALAEDGAGPGQCVFSQDAAAELCRSGRFKGSPWGAACSDTFPG